VTMTTAPKAQAAGNGAKSGRGRARHRLAQPNIMMGIIAVSEPGHRGFAEHHEVSVVSARQHTNR
jgi:hypothetical protein